MSKGCGIEFPHFGASYPDARCIDGYLWDMDSGEADEDGVSYSYGGNGYPCPVCNTKLEGIYSDGTGHVNVKCQKCGFASPMNLAYFKRKKKRNTFPFYPGGGNYKGKR